MKIYKGYKIERDGTVYNKNGTIKKLDKNSKGYYVVDLYQNGKGKRYFVHRLIGDLFLEKQKGKNIINHLDGNKLNNNYKNLKWTTYSGNIKHAYETGLRVPAINYPFNAKLIEAEVSEIKRLLKQGDITKRDIAEKFDITYQSVWRINNGTAWADIKGD